MLKFSKVIYLYVNNKKGFINEQQKLKYILVDKHTNK